MVHIKKLKKKSIEKKCCVRKVSNGADDEAAHTLSSLGEACRERTHGDSRGPCPPCLKGLQRPQLQGREHGPDCTKKQPWGAQSFLWPGHPLVWENSFLNPLTWRGTREPRALFVPRDHQPRGDCAEPRKPESSRQEELCGQGSSPTVPSPLQWAQSALRDPALSTRDTPHSRDGTRPTWQVEVQMWEWTQPYSKHLKQRWTEQKIIFFILSRKMKKHEFWRYLFWETDEDFFFS